MRARLLAGADDSALMVETSAPIPDMRPGDKIGLWWTIADTLTYPRDRVA